MTGAPKPLIFFGTCNLDFCLSVDRLPTRGQSVMGDLIRHPGGKGANQAVAAARLGLAPRFFTKLGDDEAGAILKCALLDAGVQTDAIETVRGANSGTALIIVDGDGGNIIGIESGANQSMSERDIERAANLIGAGALVVAEMGLPNAALERLFALKPDYGFELIFNPAPVRKGLTKAAWRQVDYATPNEMEAFDLTGIEVVDLVSAERAAEGLLDLGVRAVIVTLGAQGAFYADDQRRFHVPAFPVKALDTTAAGDAFTGGLAAALARSAPIERAIRYAMAVAALCVTSAGAQSAMPSAETVDAFLASQSLVEPL
jgi:ribokinase